MQGAMRCYGLGIQRDRQSGIALYEKAAVSGNSRAHFELGTLYYRGKDQDRPKAIACFTRAAETGYTPAELALGIYTLSLDEENREIEREYGKRPANTQEQLEKGRRLVTAAAEKGDLVAQYVLGVFYQEGLHFEQDEKAARQWYTRAAKQGSPQAIKELKDMDETEK